MSAIIFNIKKDLMMQETDSQRLGYIGVLMQELQRMSNIIQEKNQIQFVEVINQEEVKDEPVRNDDSV